MKIRGDGSVQHTSLPTYDNVAKPEVHETLRCMVVRATFTDDPLNVTANSPNPRVLYDVVVLGGFRTGQIISNCRLSSSLGGSFNFYERTLRAATKNVSQNALSNNDGDVVFVEFVQGRTAYPVITSIDEGISPSNQGTTSSEAPRLQWQYNGFNVEINNQGNMMLGNKEGSTDGSSKAFTPGSSKKIAVSMVGEVLTFKTQSGLTVAIDGTADAATITTSGGAQFKVDGSADKITIMTSGGAIGTFDGSGNEVDLKAQKALIEGTNSATLKSPAVNLGSESPADKAAVASIVDARLTALETALAAFIAAYNVHIVIPVNNAVLEPPFVPVPTPTGSSVVKLDP